MPRPKKVVLKEDDLATAAEAHALLAKALRFPDHYGSNFDALADCLGDIHKPTRIVLERELDDPKPWFDTLESVVRDCAQSSCYLGMTVRKS